MAYNEQIADRVRKALSGVPKVEEKKMFGGLGFMVDGKMCINVHGDELMCRIDPDMHAEALKRKGASAMKMNGREYVGFILVNESGFKAETGFSYWIDLALDYNRKAKSSKKKKKSA